MPTVKKNFEDLLRTFGGYIDFGTDLFRGIDPIRNQLYQLCEQKEVAITVMKPLGAGKLLSKEHTPFKKPLTLAQCIHYALSRPGVASVLPGCQTGFSQCATIYTLPL